MVSLTGSPETGKSIAKNAADSLKKVHLELDGGKAPVIALDDADVELAMETMSGTGYFNAIQVARSDPRARLRKGVLPTTLVFRPGRAGEGLQDG